MQCLTTNKGLCHKLAVENGVKHGRLPLEHHVDLKTRKVLTIDHGTLSLMSFQNF